MCILVWASCYHAKYLNKIYFNLLSCLPTCRETCWSPETLCHTAEWTSVFSGRAAGEQHPTWPAETQDHVPPVAGGALQTSQHQGPEASLQRVLPQPHPAPELPGFSAHWFVWVCAVWIWSSQCSFVALFRTWTSLVSEKSWRSMTKSWTLLVGPTGAWPTWRWLLSIPARRSCSSSLKQRFLLTYAHTVPPPIQRCIHLPKELSVCLCVDARHQWAGGRRSSKGHEEVESSSTWGSSGQKYRFNWKSLGNNTQ